MALSFSFAVLVDFDFFLSLFIFISPCVDTTVAQRRMGQIQSTYADEARKERRSSPESSLLYSECARCVPKIMQSRLPTSMKRPTRTGYRKCPAQFDARFTTCNLSHAHGTPCISRVGLSC